MTTPSFTPRKRFGQNFLQSAAYLQRITHVLALCKQDDVVEIGPGLGALTEHLLASVPTLSAIEIDRDLVEKLRQRWPSTLTLYSEDALQFDFTKLTHQKQNNRLHSKLRVMGNLPYNIATPLLFRLMQFAPSIQDIHVMLQREVAERLVATVGSQPYSRLSVMMQYHCHVQCLFKVPPGAFWPVPKVYSAFVRLTPYSSNSPYPEVQNFNLFTKIVKAAFNQKRKMLRNALSEFITSAQWEVLGINPMCRAQEISVAEYIKIANAVASSKLKLDK